MSGVLSTVTTGFVASLYLVEAGRDRTAEMLALPQNSLTSAECLTGCEQPERSRHQIADPR